MAFIPHNSISLGHQRLGFVVPHIVWVSPMDSVSPSATIFCFVCIVDVFVEVILQAVRTLGQLASNAPADLARCHKYSIH